MTSSFRLKNGGDSIGEVLLSVRERWWVVAICSLAVGILALGVSLAQSPIYRATTTLYVTASGGDNAAAAYQGSMASQQRVSSYTKLVTSDAVVRSAIRTSGESLSVDEAKRSLSSVASTETVLLSVSFNSTSAEQAAIIANAVSESMVDYVANLETPSGGGPPLAKLTVVTPASVPSSPVSPKVSRNVAMGVLVGFVFGLVGILFAARFRTKIVTVEELEAAASLPVLASIPDDEALVSTSIVSFGFGSSRAAEGFRKLRTSLSFASVDSPANSVVVTSAVAGEGKTTTAINLACALAETGRRVVLVDADLRRPRVAERLGLTSAVGLTDCLSSGGNPENFVQSTAIESLYVLASGSVPPNASELLESAKSGELFAALRELYDNVIVDSAPVLPVSDSLALSKWVDGTIIVAMKGFSKSRDVWSACNELARSGSRIVGAVFTAADPIEGYRYEYRQKL